MKFKKFIAVLLTTAMAAGMLVGCGSKDAASKEGDKVTINVTRACFNLAEPDTAQVKKVEEKINAYLKEKGANFDIFLTELSSGTYTEKANASLLNKEINLFWTASWEQTVGTNEMFANNLAYDITNLLPGTDLYNSMDKGQWDATKYDGKNYFVPVYKDNVEGYDLMFRKDLVDKFGWDLSKVKSLKDIEPMLEDCKNEGLKYPYLTQRTAMFFRYYINDFDFFTQASWLAVDRSTDSVVNPVASSQYKEFCTLMSQWVEKGYLSLDDAQKVTTDQTTQTKDWGISWWTDIPVNAEANTRYNQEVEMAAVTDRWAHSTSALGSCYAITKNSTEAQAKACIEFLGYLYTDSKLADIYTFGIEGENFTYEGNKVNQKPATDTNYHHSMWESASATVVTPLTNEPDNKAELYKAFNGGAKTSCAAGFRFDKKPVEAEYAACDNVFNEYGFGLENGNVAVGDIDKTIADYQAALDAAGYQKVLAEFQKQYDEWKKNK